MRQVSSGPRSRATLTSYFSGSAGKGAIRLGAGVWTYRDAEFHTESRIEIGAGSSFQRGVLINGTVAIGRGCIFAPGVN